MCKCLARNELTSLELKANDRYNLRQTWQKERIKLCNITGTTLFIFYAQANLSSYVLENQNIFSFSIAQFVKRSKEQKNLSNLHKLNVQSSRKNIAQNRKYVRNLLLISIFCHHLTFNKFIATLEFSQNENSFDIMRKTCKYISWIPCDDERRRFVNKIKQNI